MCLLPGDDCFKENISLLRNTFSLLPHFYIIIITRSGYTDQHFLLVTFESYNENNSIRDIHFYADMSTTMHTYVYLCIPLAR